MTQDAKPEDAPPSSPSRFAAWIRHAENGVLAFLLLMMAVIPVVESVRRGWIQGAADYLQHLTLWVGFIGAMVATRERRHLQIGSIIEGLPERVKHVLGLFGATVCVMVCAALFWASLKLVLAEAPALPESVRSWLPASWLPFMEELMLFEDGWLLKVGGVFPVWLAESIMPFGFAVQAVRFVLYASPRKRDRFIVALGFPLSLLLALLLSGLAAQLVIPSIVLLVVAAFCGAPIFVLLGGAALVLFWADGVTVASIPAETYRIVTNPVFPTIPIFTLVGFILSESRASQRMERVFSAWFGCIPGGTAVAATLLCAFFTTFTGASGVTILALGALLLPVLLGNGFSERFSIGLLTSTGSLGLLLPPSLVVILYGVMAKVPIPDMFIAAILPGHLLLVPICIACVLIGRRVHVKRCKFDLREALRALWLAKWEVAMPLLVLILLFGGFCTLVEAAAITAVYALLVETAIYRDLKFRNTLSMLVRCGTLVGGILIVLGVAMGLTSYLVDAQVPMNAANWVQEHIESRWLFLLALNIALILVGCFMDIFSALVVVVPLILPMAQAFGIHPAHLGVIFLANLQLGYLTPPIGMNLFLASFRFDKPLMRVAAYAFPFLLLLLVVVLLITYIPWLTVGVLELVK